MHQDTHDDILHRIDNRLARVEERLKDLPEIKASILSNTEQLSNLKTKVAAVSASIALVVTFAAASVKSFFR